MRKPSILNDDVIILLVCFLKEKCESNVIPRSLKLSLRVRLAPLIVYSLRILFNFFVKEFVYVQRQSEFVTPLVYYA